MQSFISRMNRTNEFANLGKRCAGVLAQPVIPGFSLPLMVTSTVLLTPDVDQPEPGSQPSPAKRAIFSTPAGRKVAVLARLTVPGGLAVGLVAGRAAGSWSRHREWIHALTSQTADQLCRLAGRLGLELNRDKCGGSHRPRQESPVSRYPRS
jgi:hypothetical protein